MIFQLFFGNEKEENKKFCILFFMKSTSSRACLKKNICIICGEITRNCLLIELEDIV
jgi:hypothetical protein